VFGNLFAFIASYMGSGLKYFFVKFVDVGGGGGGTVGSGSDGTPFVVNDFPVSWISKLISFCVHNSI